MNVAFLRCLPVCCESNASGHVRYIVRTLGDAGIESTPCVFGSVRGRCDQAIKGARWMSWRQEAMKDVGTCDKPRGAGNQASIRGFLNGATRQPCAVIGI